MLIDKDKLYKAYFRLQSRKDFYKGKQSEARHKGDKEDAEDYGFAAAKISEAMQIVREDCDLVFDQ